jgi:hypothetical protein
MYFYSFRLSRYGALGMDCLVMEHFAQSVANEKIKEIFPKLTGAP